MKFLLMNIEAFSTKKGVDVAEFFVKKFKVFMTVDESTTIKNRQAKRTKAICSVGRGAVMRRILTGSPVTKSPMDLYSQMEFLSPDILGFKSYYAFQGRYAVVQRRSMGAHSFNQILGFQRLDELTETLDQHSFRVRKEDCLDLPDKVYMRREVELTLEQSEAYVQMKNLALARLDSGDLSTTQNVLTQIMRLQQICLGSLTDDDGTVHPLKSNRQDALLDICDEIQGKAIIWATWTQDIVRLPRPCATALASKRSQRSTVKPLIRIANRSWKLSKIGSRSCVSSWGTPKPAGYGLTLTAANTVVYYSNSYDLGASASVGGPRAPHRAGEQGDVHRPDIAQDHRREDRGRLADKIKIADLVLGEDARSWLE
jgi:hypothetical protein